MERNFAARDRSPKRYLIESNLLRAIVGIGRRRPGKDSVRGRIFDVGRKGAVGSGFRVGETSMENHGVDFPALDGEDCGIWKFLSGTQRIAATVLRRNEAGEFNEAVDQRARRNVCVSLIRREPVDRSIDYRRGIRRIAKSVGRESGGNEGSVRMPVVDADPELDETLVRTQLVQRAGQEQRRGFRSPA